MPGTIYAQKEVVADLEITGGSATPVSRYASFHCRLPAPSPATSFHLHLRFRLTLTSYSSLFTSLILFFFLGTMTSAGQEVRLTVHGPSMHLYSINDNDHTWGGGGELAWQSNSWRYGVLAGAYHNSVWNLTVYQALAGSYEVNDWLGVGLGIMAATGYDEEACYKTPQGSESCFTLDWARPVTFIPMPFVSIGKRVKIRVVGSSTLDAGMIHAMGSVRLY